MIRQSYDLDADALYVKLTDHKVTRTVEIDAGTLVTSTPTTTLRASR